MIAQALVLVAVLGVQLVGQRRGRRQQPRTHRRRRHLFRHSFPIQVPKCAIFWHSCHVWVFSGTLSPFAEEDKKSGMRTSSLSSEQSTVWRVDRNHLHLERERRENRFTVFFMSSSSWTCAALKLRNTT